MTRIASNAAACWTAAASIAVAGAGVVIACGLGHDVRHLLGFDFGGIPRTPGEALRIAAHNGWMAALALIAAAIVSRVDAPARAFLDASLAMMLIVNAIRSSGSPSAHTAVAGSPRSRPTPRSSSRRSLSAAAHTCMHASRQSPSARSPSRR